MRAIMFLSPRVGHTRSTLPTLLLSSLFLLFSLPTANAACTTDPTNTTVEQCSPSSSTLKSGPSTLKPGPTAIFILSVTFIIVVAIGGNMLYIFLRKRRERKKRDEHRWKAWEFRDMQRSTGSLQPPPRPLELPVRDPGHGSRAFQSSSEITLVPSRLAAPDKQTMFESSGAPMKGPRYPPKTHGQS